MANNANSGNNNNNGNKDDNKGSDKIMGLPKVWFIVLIICLVLLCCICIGFIVLALLILKSKSGSTTNNYNEKLLAPKANKQAYERTSGYVPPEL